MEPLPCPLAGAMVCVAMPAGVCTITATPPPANVMPALTLPDALVAVALALVAFGLALAPAGAPGVEVAVVLTKGPVLVLAVGFVAEPASGVDVELLKSMTVEFVPTLPLPATCVICETPLTDTLCPPVAVACVLAPVLRASAVALMLFAGAPALTVDRAAPMPPDGAFTTAAVAVVVLLPCTAFALALAFALPLPLSTP